jgi:hypothetical protein
MDKLKSWVISYDTWEEALTAIKTKYNVAKIVEDKVIRYVEEFNKWTLDSLKKND